MTRYPLSWPDGWKRTPDDVDGVTYREVVGFVGYAVGSDGSVWGCLGRGKRAGQIDREWRLMTAHTRSKGHKRLPYQKVGLVKGGKLYHLSVHAIVLEAFCGPCPSGMQGLHEDDNPKNNAIDNLRWGTPKANSEQRTRTGRQVRGSSVTGSRLTAEQVASARRRFAAGETQSAIAREFGVTQRAIWSIVRGKTWKHLMIDGVNV